jgi:PQQ-dependent dehydrogenase (methanol/ethanol family)
MSWERPLWRWIIKAILGMLLVFIGRNFQVAEAQAQTAPTEWRTFGGDLANQRYSTLSQINATNVSHLQVAWTFQTGVANHLTSFECVPLVIDGVMYVTSPAGQVFALKADSGDLIWQFNAAIDVSPTKENMLEKRVCCGFANRGVAYSTGRVYFTTIDARLFALDAKTGKLIPSFGDKGIVTIAKYKDGYSETAAPVVSGNKIIIGVAGAENPIRGFVSAYNTDTGALVWRWYTVPSPNEPGGDTWPDNGIYQQGGGSTWMSPAVDEGSGQVLIGVGNPNPDFFGVQRAGDNLYTSSVVSLDLATGKLRWYFQEVKHDLWDYDQAAPPVLFDAHISGRLVKAVGAAGKTGWFYVLDRATGRSLFPMKEITVPQDPIQATAKTQIIPAFPAFIDQENIFTPPSPTGVLIAPGISGGSEWSPVAFSPQTNFVYVDAVHKPYMYRYDPNNPERGAIVPPGTRLFGAFTAIDVDTGLVRWRTPTEPHPVGGLMATAGRLVFAGEANGHFVALDALNGNRLWSFNCGAGVNAPPITYEHNGRQYVAVAAGGLALEGFTSSGYGQDNFRRGDTVYVFRLP